MRLAWACEFEGLTQAEDAERFGLTRLRVNKALNEVRQSGMLRISIDSIYAAAADAEWRLQERFNLKDMVVVPKPKNQNQSRYW